MNRIEKLKRLRESAMQQRHTHKVFQANRLIREHLESLADRANHRFVVQQGQSSVTYIR